MKYIKSIPEPQSNIERSHAKYLCRMYYFSIFYKIIANITALIALVFSVHIYNRKNKCTNPQTVDYLLIKSPTVKYNDILPEGLSRDYGSPFLVDKPTRKEWYLTKEAKIIFRKNIKKYPFKFYYNYIIFRELCMHSVLMDSYNTQAIAVYVYERNIAGPILKYLCENKNMEFVSFMHGEYLLHLIQGFMEFTKFYVWDKHYSKMFENDLRSSVDEFIVYTPLKYQKPYLVNDLAGENEYYICYYFGGESTKRIEKVAEAFHILKENGRKCKVRPHPRRSNFKMITEKFKDFEIEDPQNTSIENSIISSRYLAALSSTVLSEGYNKGKEIVIDDYSEPKRYENLKQRKYILLNKEHKLFSELINENITEKYTNNSNA